ncbi:MAG TPA: hypothetical protein VLM85_04460 [Polyangiaceae bacterium]|nr:hypothetical protein [Polyangiaceae bacterium]
MRPIYTRAPPQRPAPNDEAEAEAETEAASAVPVSPLSRRARYHRSAHAPTSSAVAAPAEYCCSSIVSVSYAASIRCCASEPLIA